MTLGEFLKNESINIFAFLPADALSVRLPRLLPQTMQAKTVVLAAIPYRMSGESSHLAQFARCRDYHRYAEDLGKRCNALLVQQFPGCTAMGFADHSPYDEVKCAAMAGLGLLGDNGLLITERYSSYVFLFELVTSLSEEALASQGIPRGTGIIRECEHCGACRNACPGGCTNGDRTRCLSAISQKKAALTEEETTLLQQAAYIWGCDICQDVCPHSQNAEETNIPYFRENRLLMLTEEQLDRMSDEEYRSYAFGWRKKEVMARNLRLGKESFHD